MLHETLRPGISFAQRSAALSQSSLSVVISGMGALELDREDALVLNDNASFGVPVLPFDPILRLGRKGLRQKDKATQLAMCAAATALEHAGLPLIAQDQLAPDEFAVVVSSNLGNLETVCRVAQTIRKEGVSGTSPLDLPNASSNVIASSIAIRFGCRQSNLMLCNGGTSGLDAIQLAANLIRARRATRVLVVGVEAHSDAAKILFEQAGASADPTDLAIAVVVESELACQARAGKAYARLGAYRQSAIKPGLHQTSPVQIYAVEKNNTLLGNTYGAEGVLKIAQHCYQVFFGSHTLSNVPEVAEKVSGANLRSSQAATVDIQVQDLWSAAVSQLRLDLLSVEPYQSVVTDRVNSLVSENII